MNTLLSAIFLLSAASVVFLQPPVPETRTWEVYYDGEGVPVPLLSGDLRENTLRYGWLPCSCQDSTCGCCMGMNINAFNFSRNGCMNFTYLPDDFAIEMNIFMNDESVFKRNVSAKNPPPACMEIPMPYLPALQFCIKIFDIYTPGRNLHMCVDFETRIERAPILVLQFDCFVMGSDGLSHQKPTESSEVVSSEGGQTQGIKASNDTKAVLLAPARVSDILVMGSDGLSHQKPTESSEVVSSEGGMTPGIKASNNTEAVLLAPARVSDILVMASDGLSHQKPIKSSDVMSSGGGGQTQGNKASNTNKAVLLAPARVRDILVMDSDGMSHQKPIKSSEVVTSGGGQTPGIKASNNTEAVLLAPARVSDILVMGSDGLSNQKPTEPSEVVSSGGGQTEGNKASKNTEAVLPAATSVSDILPESQKTPMTYVSRVSLMNATD